MSELIIGVKNIIFDLGEVITDVNFPNTFKAFDQLAGKDTHQLYNFHKQSPVFDQIETGKISPQQFRDELKKLFGKPFSDAEIDNAWNAMLGDTPLEKLEFLHQLRPNFKTFILSNTNQIHINWINDYLNRKYGVASLNPFFDKVYLSHEIGFRKPEPEAYLHILQQHDLRAEETLFIDDKEENTQAAQKLGMKIYQLTNKEDLYKILS
jgi:glucose-1-phosphatase